jgi:hypothetical protein
MFFLFPLFAFAVWLTSVTFLALIIFTSRPLPTYHRPRNRISRLLAWNWPPHCSLTKLLASIIISFTFCTRLTIKSCCRYFALSEWVERDLMILERIDTSVNEADHFTKILERTLFYRHVDHIMGHIPPAYSPCYNSAVYPGTVIRNDDVSHDNLVIRPEAARAAKCYLSLDNWTHVLAHTHVPVQSNLLFHSHIGLWGGGVSV